MVCPKCGHPIEEETRICPICGKTLRHSIRVRILAILGIVTVILINAALIVYLYWNL